MMTIGSRAPGKGLRCSLSARDSDKAFLHAGQVLGTPKIHVRVYTICRRVDESMVNTSRALCGIAANQRGRDKVVEKRNETSLESGLTLIVR